MTGHEGSPRTEASRTRPCKLGPASIGARLVAPRFVRLPALHQERSKRHWFGESVKVGKYTLGFGLGGRVPSVGPLAPGPGRSCASASYPLDEARQRPRERRPFVGASLVCESDAGPIVQRGRTGAIGGSTLRVRRLPEPGQARVLPRRKLGAVRSAE